MGTMILNLRERSVIRTLNRFLASPYYIMLVVLAAAASNLFALELPVYTVYVLTAVYTCVFGRDLQPMIPLVICSYLAPSLLNNPGRNSHTIFAFGSGGEYMAVLVCVLVLALVVHIIIHARTFFTRRRLLLPGLLMLCGGYLFSGMFSPAYPDQALKNLGFAALQAAAVLLPYYLISGGVRWSKNRKDYFCWTGFGVGCLLVCQILWIYLTRDITESGVIVRERIFTGWGIHNNMGGMLAMMIPFAFYLASRYHRGWIGTVAGSGFLVGVFMTCSRSAILMGCGIFIVCIYMMLRSASNRKGNSVALVIVLVGVALVILIFRTQLAKLFWNLISIGTDPSYRDVTWSEGLKQFLKYPIFGGGFYPIDFAPWDFSTMESFSDFFPPRWHNTVIQLMASTGTVGLLAYGFHRLQTVRLFLKVINREKAFIGASLFVLLGTSLFDCHFFNIGPTLFYSMGLAFAEKCGKSTEDGDL